MGKAKKRRKAEVKEEKEIAAEVGAGVEVDYWRQLDIFSPTKFKTPVTVIGAGATGSWITKLLAKMGVRDITVYDFDKVKNHNVPNQVFRLQDIGRLKVEALAEVVKEATGICIKPVAKKVTKENLKGIVFIVTDTMASRKQIWKSSVCYQLNVQLMIETRLGAEGGMIYAVRPAMPKQVEAYEKTLYSDKEAEESPCTRRAIAPTVATIAGMAVFTLVNFATEKPYANETLISLSPPFVQTRKFL